MGAVAVTASGERFTGYTHETSATHHAEQEAVAKALAAGADLRGAAMYSSMEPCSCRRSEPESCSDLLVRLGFARAVFALYEPDCFVRCQGRSGCGRQESRCALIPTWAKRCAGSTRTSAGTNGFNSVLFGVKLS